MVLRCFDVKFFSWHGFTGALIVGSKLQMPTKRAEPFFWAVNLRYWCWLYNHFLQSLLLMSRLFPYFLPHLFWNMIRRHTNIAHHFTCWECQVPFQRASASNAPAGVPSMRQAPIFQTRLDPKTLLPETSQIPKDREKPTALGKLGWTNPLWGNIFFCGIAWNVIFNCWSAAVSSGSRCLLHLQPQGGGDVHRFVHEPPAQCADPPAGHIGSISGVVTTCGENLWCWKCHLYLCGFWALSTKCMDVFWTWYLDVQQLGL